MDFNEQPNVPPAPQAPVPPAPQAPVPPAPQQAPNNASAADLQAKVRELSDKKITVGNLNVSYAVVTTVVAAVIVFIAVFLPAVSASTWGLSLSRSLIQGGDGWIVLALIVAVSVLAILRKALAALIIAGLDAVVWLIELIDLNSKMSDMGSYVDVSLGIGFWLWTIGMFVMLAATAVEFYNLHQLKKEQAAQVPGSVPLAPAGQYPMGAPAAPAAAPSYAAPAPVAPSAPAADASLPPYATSAAPAVQPVAEVSQTDVYEVPDPSAPAGVDDVVVNQQETFTVPESYDAGNAMQQPQQPNGGQ